MPLTYLPDADPTTAGLLVDTNALVSKRGAFMAVPSIVSLGTAFTGSGSLTMTGFEAYETAVTGKVYFANRSGRVSKVVWTGSVFSYFEAGPIMSVAPTRFCQFGNTVLATNKTDGLFNADTGSLHHATFRANVIFTVGLQVMAFDYNDGVNNYIDGWACSKLGSSSSWSFAVADNSANGRLLETPGPIVAGAALGGYAVAYKADAIYLGEFVGAPVIWSWRRVDATTGALSQESTVSTDRVHYYIDPVNQDIRVFDGQQSRSIGEGIRSTFFRTLVPNMSAVVYGAYDRLGNRVVWMGQNSFEAFAFHIDSGKWSRFIVYGSGNANWCLVDVRRPVGSWQGTADNAMSVFLLNANVLYTIKPNGAFALKLKTGRLGKNGTHTGIRTVRPKFLSALSTLADVALTPATITHAGGTPTNGAAVALTSITDPRFDYRQDSPWHEFELNFGTNIIAGTTGGVLSADQPEVSDIEYVWLPKKSGVADSE